MSGLSLLPAGSDDFRTQSYWDRFFTQRPEAFEWYITFDDITDVIKAHVKVTSNIVMVGCGNSDMSARAYDAGFHQITNVDYSPVVIEEMQKRNKQRTEMRWLEMNMLDMKTFKEGTFDVAIDKGALDALYSGDSPQVRADAMRMSVELARVLKPAGGKYMCISLLEERILSHLLRTFRALPGWQLDMYKVDEPRKESNQLPFVLVFTRAPGLQGLPVVLHFDGELHPLSFAAAPEQRAKHVAETESYIVKMVKAARWQYQLRQQLVKVQDGAHQTLELWDKDPAKQATPRFTLSVVDNTRLLSHKVKGTCGVFITPQGRESEWLFATDDGHKQLSDDLGYRRLIVVTLGRAPIPYLSSGDDIGQREILYQGSSPLSGPLTVEDVRMGKLWVRRLVFQQNRGLVQSECALTSSDPAPVASGAKGQKRPVERQPDHSTLQSDYHAAIVASFAFLGVAGGWAEVEFLIIGLGGAALPVFMHAAFPESLITVVEIDPTVVDVATKFFGLTQSANLNVEVADGLAYVAQLPPPTDRKRVIIVDADSKDLSAGLSCPPAAFLEPVFLRNTAQKVGPSGLVVYNIVCRAADRFRTAVQAIEAVFPATYSVRMEEDLNVVHVAMHQRLASPEKLIEVYAQGKGKEPWAKHLNLESLCRRAAGLTVAEESSGAASAAPAPAAVGKGINSGRGGAKGKKKRR